MKKRFLLMILIIFILTTIGYSDSDDSRAFRRQSATTKTYSKKIALVIGNDKYKTSPLSNAVDDAIAMRDFLENHGFEVVFLKDGTTAQMRKKIAYFSSLITKNSVGLVYYSGHGTQEKSEAHGVRNYLIPVDDTRIKDVADLDEFAISLDYILNKLVNRNNGLNIVMLDACRTSMRAFSRTRSGGLSPSQAQGVYIAYATASNTTARDDSLFRKSFIKHASRPLKLIDIFEEVKMDVYNQTAQNPFTSNGKRGAFYFTQPTKSNIKINNSKLRLKSNLYLFTISINKYKDNSPQLSYPNSNATELTKKIKKIGKKVFKNIYTYSLRDNQVSKWQVENKFYEISQHIKVNDTFIFYISGYGISDPIGGDYYFLTSAEIIKQAIGLNQFKKFISGIKAIKTVILIDSYYNGSIFPKELFNSSFRRLGMSLGSNIIAMRTKRGEEYQKHGLLTYAILNAMNTKEAYGIDNQLSISEIAQYTHFYIPKITKELFGEEQKPTIYMNEGTNFYIGGI